MNESDTEKSLNSPYYSSGTIPIVVGVTGHRDLIHSDTPVLTQATKSVLSEIEKQTPHSPHILISCLAEGADRIAARCALELGWGLGVVLPTSVTKYELDFDSQESKDEYSEFLSHALWIECLNDSTDGSTDYLGAGIRLAQQSQLLIAFWDGKSIGLSGGTSDVVAMFLNEIPDTGKGLSGNTPPDARPVIHIETRRSRDPCTKLATGIGAVSWIAPSPGGMSELGELDRWREILRHIDQFNADANVHIRLSASSIETSRKYLDGNSFSSRQNIGVIPDASGAMFAIADSMSFHAQQERERLFYRLSGLAVLAVIFEQIYSGLLPSPLFLALAVLSALAALYLFQSSKRHRIENRYLDYRSLAEACRVQHFWLHSGIRASVADNFLMEQRDELEWIRQALRTNELSVNVATTPVPDDTDKISRVRNHWVEDQRHYFVGTRGKQGGDKATFNKRNNVAWSRISTNIFMAGIATVLVLVASHNYLIEHFDESGEFITQCATVVYSLLFATSGMIKIFQEVKGFGEHSKSYRRSGILMQRASHRLSSAIRLGDIATAQQIIYETGCEALDENDDWLILHRDRPVEVPLG